MSTKKAGLFDDSDDGEEFVPKPNDAAATTAEAIPHSANEITKVEEGKTTDPTSAKQIFDDDDDKEEEYVPQG